jgi:hypothetical protein
MTREQLRATNPRSTGEVRSQSVASQVVPFCQFRWDLSQIEQLAEIRQAVAVVQHTAIGSTEDPLVAMAAQVALKNAQTFDADWYSALPDLAPHCDHS